MLYLWHKIGERIRQCRKEKGMNQEQLADRIEDETGKTIKRQTVAGWENGKPICKLEQLAALCHIFDCEMGYLLCEDGYNHKTRAKTDIEYETGLSTLAVDNLIAASGQLEKVLDPNESLYDVQAYEQDYADPNNRNFIIGSLAKIRFLNLLLEESAVWEEISVCAFDYRKYIDAHKNVPYYDIDGVPMSLFARASAEKAKLALERLFEKSDGDTFDY